MKDKAVAIDHLDLDCVQKKLSLSVEKGGYDWPTDAAKDAIEEYRHFLKAVLERNEKEDSLESLSPDRVVDIVWHTHILFTQKYHKDCDTIFNQYIHHEPIIELGDPT